MSHALQGLADELFIHILSFLPCQDILRCALTCRTLCAVINGSIELQYLIELGVQGLDPVFDSDQSHLFTSEKLQLLQRSASAWNNDQNVPIRTHTLSNDLLSTSSHMTNGCLSVSGNAYLSSEIVDLRADTTKNKPLRRRWAWEGYNPHSNHSVCCIRLDVSQDVLVVASFLAPHPLFRLDFFSISTPEIPQPAAARTRLYSHQPTSNGDWHLFASNLRIYGRHIAFYGAVCRDEDLSSFRARTGGKHCVQRQPPWSLQLWNWQVEQPSQCIMTGECTDFEAITDFSFLDTQRLLVLKSGGELEVYSFADLSKSPELLRRYSLPIRPCSSMRLKFTPPDLLSDVVPLQGSHPERKRPLWVPRLEDQVLAITFPIAAALIISLQPILHPSMHWREVIIDGRRSIPWSTWGPPHSRLFRGSYIMLCDVHGSRAVLTPNYPKLVVVDFNLQRVRRAGRDVVLESTTVKPSPLTREVTRWLPYAECVQDGSVGRYVNDIHMDEEGVVLLGWDKLFSR